MKEGSKVKIDLIVIGNPNSGKTSLIRRFIEGEGTLPNM
jgi:GTPase SAR1 family protein